MGPAPRGALASEIRDGDHAEAPSLSLSRDFEVSAGQAVVFEASVGVDAVRQPPTHVLVT
jgi:hypothetical protein